MADQSKRPKLVEVEWHDARSIYEQIELGHVAEKCNLFHRFTVGYLVHKDKERVIVAGTFDPAEKKLSENHLPDDDGGADFTVFPRGWITAIVALETAEKESE